jgi:hypothetical protein
MMANAIVEGSMPLAERALHRRRSSPFCNQGANQLGGKFFYLDLP